MVRALVVATALVYAAIGVWSLVDPQGMLGSVGMTLDRVGRVEARAMYGGLELGLAAFFVWCAVTPQRARIGLVGSVASFAGLGITRTAAYLASGASHDLMAALCAVELSAVVVGGWALWRTRGEA